MESAATAIPDGSRYAKCIEVSKRICWDIDDDVIRGRSFDFSREFLPEGLSRMKELSFLSAQERRLLSQIQGRTYAYIFGLVERYISAKILDLSRDYVFGDQVSLEALVRFTDEEVKHQELFRRIEAMIGSEMPVGYVRTADANAVAEFVLGKSSWAVLALTCHIELFTQAHYKESIEPNNELCDLFKDVFLFHWREESQHAILDELEWRKVDDTISGDERDRYVEEFIELVAGVDGILQGQARADCDYFFTICGRHLADDEQQSVRRAVLAAYRWQYIFSGATHPRFGSILESMTTEAQRDRIGEALGSLQ